jgi:uncharacterized protein YndB with AHSA1/START domain
MAVANLSKIERKTVIRAPRERVWRAITEVAEFSKWFRVETAGPFQSGARVKMISTHESCMGLEFWITIEQIEPGRLFSWRWHPGMPEEGIDYSVEPMTLVEFRLEDAPGGTLVTVTETGFDQISLARRARIFEENDKGWEFQMHSLTGYVGGSA